MMRLKDPKGLDSERLKKLRLTLGFNQRQMAQEFQVTAGAIGHWENGSRAIPGPIMLIIDLYEKQLSSSNHSSDTKEKIIQNLSEQLATGFLSRVSLKCNERVKKQKETIQRKLKFYLKKNISKDPILRTIQLAFVSKIVDSIAGMHGLPVKVAQLASYLDPTISPKIRDLFASLQDQARPVPAGVAAQVVQEELGRPPHKIFSEWQPKPFAAASIGQVHLARLASGEKVAVKIQYPAVADQMKRYFQALSFVNAFASLVKGSDTETFREIHSKILQECDYILEAEYQERFRKIFEKDSSIYVPRIYPEYCSKRVLTMDFVEGVNLHQFARKATQKERNRAAETIVRFYTDATFNHNLQHGDPHPGNFLFSKDQVCFLDFGRVRSLSEADVKFNLAFRSAIMTHDRDAARKLLREADTVKNWDSFDFDGFWNTVLILEEHYTVDRPFKFTQEHVVRCVAAAKAYKGWGNLRLQSWALWVICGNASIRSILAELQAESNWRRNAQEWMLGKKPNFY